MSKYSRPLSRPRTRVYDTNYNIGESYYKSALDGIDRKYGRMGPSSAASDAFFPMRQVPLPPLEREPEISTPRSAFRDMAEDEFLSDRRRQTSALLGEFDALVEGRMRNGMMQKERTPMRGGRNLEDEIEDNITSSLKKMRAVKTRSLIDEFEDDSMFSSKGGRKKLEFSDKMMDSVGLTGRARAALEEEGSTLGRMRFLRMTSEGGEGDELTKWTALKPGAVNRRSFLEEDEEITTGAAARARKSRARLDDLESEIQALSEKSAAREKRVRDLKALVQENETNALENLQTTVKVTSSIQSEKKKMAY